MKEVLSQGRRQRMSEVPPPPVNLSSRRRLIMQQLERHSNHYADNDQAAVDHYKDNDHSLQQESADDHDHQKLTNGSSLQAKCAKKRLTAQNNKAYYDNHLEKYTNDDPQAAAADHDDDDVHLQQQESAAADHYQKRDSNNVSALRAKYGLPNHNHTAYSRDEYGEHYTDDDRLLQQEVAAEHGSRTMPSTLQAAQSYRADNHDKHIEHCADDHHLLQQDFKADLNQKKGSRIAPSTLQAAQAQAAELRALHSAMLNNYGFADRSSAVYSNYHHKQKQEDPLLHKSRPKKASKKKSKVYTDDDQVEKLENPLSSTSSASSTADCFIRPAHEYPIFMPSHEDMLLSKMDGVNSMNRRSSVDNCEALMREERLNYIFDHDNKRSFSGTQYSDHSTRDNNISCLHESLNLPRRSASSFMHLHDKDDQLLHHMSLNLPQGSQHHLFNTANYKQNPLFDHFNPSDKIASLHPMNGLAGSSDSLSIKRFNDNNLHNAAPNNPMKDQAGQYPYELKAAFTGRQRALLEFLSEEPARMRAFNELAAMETPEYDKVQMQRSSQTDAAALAEGYLTSSRRIKGKYESTPNVDHLQASSDHHLPHQSTHDPSLSTARVRQKLAHTLSIDHHDQSTNAGGVSCDKCRPLAGAHTVVGTLSDSRDLGAAHPPSNTVNTAAAAPKEKPDQKKPSIKGWFFRGKKKHSNTNVLNSHANPASNAAASQDQTLITSGASSAVKEIQSTASTCTSTAATTSHVFSSLINSEAEKELEVAMAMDLMELKVLQAKTKRDAAMAEVLELRLAMDSMAKKLVEVERHCVELKTQLMQHQDDQTLTDYQHNAPAAAGMINTTGQLNVNSDDADAAETPNTDHYESDSIDHREERRPSEGISMIRAGVSSGYGGRSSSRSVQPSKAEFFNAVAEARVGIKQISRVLLQYIQESKGAWALLPAPTDHQIKAGQGIEEEATGGPAAGMKINDQGGLMNKGIEKENWGPILIMCREAARREKTGMIGMSCSSSSSRGRGVAYCVEALISMAFHEHFENVGFDKNGTHKILDPSQRALAFYHSFLKLAKLTPTQLLTQPSPLYNPAFDHFCSRKMRAVGRAVGCPGKLWPDELARTFLSAARAVWLLHHLAFAYHSRPPGIFRVAAYSSFDARFMEVLPGGHVSPSSQLLVSLMVMPGFFLPGDIIKCKVLAS